MNDKEHLRQQALSRRRGLTEAARQQASESIRANLIDLIARSGLPKDAPLLVYRALADEVDTTALFESGIPGRDIYAPVTHHAGEMHWCRAEAGIEWKRGDFGVLEPVGGEPWSPDRPAVLLCPLVGFDRRGNRLGMGKGCFDRWLGEMKSHILLGIGLAFACQECADIPAEDHDIPLHIIITEGETIACRNS